MNNRDLAAFCVICNQQVDLVPIRFRRYLYDPDFSLNNLLQLMFQNYEFLICQPCNEDVLASFTRCYHERRCYCFLCREDYYFPYGSCMMYDWSYSDCYEPIIIRQHVHGRCIKACKRLQDIYSAINLNNWCFVDEVEYIIEEGLIDEFYIIEYEMAFSAVCIPIEFPRRIPRPIDMSPLPLFKAIQFDLNVEKIEYIMRSIKL
ncbi:uncharacterized protein LOC116166169 [Photinus pyralis]|uniref:uncharacterized protein LOC116166169 n=1 Tax=Photinus pyralis TaxID=7054 RepID=UPI0012673DC4|nr:uncharacterized protein LOC116166169 [Photinus pyralis]